MWIFAALFCLTLLDLKSAQCLTACQWAGYDSGRFDGEACECIEWKNFESMTGRKRLIPPNRARTGLSPYNPDREQ